MYFLRRTLYQHRATERRLGSWRKLRTRRRGSISGKVLQKSSDLDGAWKFFNGNFPLINITYNFNSWTYVSLSRFLYIYILASAVDSRHTRSSWRKLYCIRVTFLFRLSSNDIFPLVFHFSDTVITLLAEVDWNGYRLGLYMRWMMDEDTNAKWHDAEN